MHSTRLYPARPNRRLGPIRSARLPFLRCAIALGALVLPLAGQTHLGQDFWLADTFTNVQSFTIAIGNPNAVTANVTIFNVIEGSTVDSVAPGAVKIFTFADHELAVQGVAIDDDPVHHVTSDVEVAVFVFDPLANEAFNDACLVLPVPTLGKRHRIANFVNADNSGAQLVGVVAVAAGVTNVQILDDTQTVVNNVNLLPGQYFQRINSINVGALPSDDMTGWEVVADQPVAAFTGSTTTIGAASCCADPLLEQLLPETKLAQAYAVAPLRTRPLGCTTPSTCAADLFRFVATQNNTTLTTTPNVGGGTLNEADYLEITTSTPFIIQGDKPFFGYQYLPSLDASFDSLPAAATGDPALVDIIPVEEFRIDYLFHVEGSFPVNFLNIVAPVGSTLLLDNNPLTGTCDPIGTLNSTSYCSMRVPVAGGTHRVTSTNYRFGLTVSGFAPYSSYAYPAGLGMECTPGTDGWMRDADDDDGTEPDPSTANMWDSPDIWVRNQPDTNLQFQHQHQNPIASVQNYVYVKLRNRGCDPLEQGNVFTYFAKAATGLVWSTNWIGSATNGDVIGSMPVGTLVSNGELVLEYPWTPPSGGQFSLLARLVSPDDPMTFTETTNVNANTKNNNNVVWKSVTVVGVPNVTVATGALTDYSVIVRNVESTAVVVDVELGEPGGPLETSFLAQGAIRMTLPPALFQAWELAGGSSMGLSLVPGTTTFEVDATFAALSGIPLGVGEEHPVVLNFAQSPRLPFALRQRLTLDPYVIRQRSNGSATSDGGVTFTFPRSAPVRVRPR